MSAFQAAALFAASLPFALGLVVWSILHRRWRRWPVRLWVMGALALGAGGVLALLNARGPQAAAAVAAHVLLVAAIALRIAALRMELGQNWRREVLIGLCVADNLLVLLVAQAGSEHQTLMAGWLLSLVWTLALAWQAWTTARWLRSRSGWVLTGIEGLLAAALALRLLNVGVFGAPVDAADIAWDQTLLTAATGAEALYGTLAYLGVVLDRVGAAARRSRDEQMSTSLELEALQNITTGPQTPEQQRERWMQMLAHEIRQPLHNASGALQAAAMELEQLPDATPEVQAHKARTRARLARSQSRLGAVQSVLDNTLAAASLLTRDSSPLVRMNTDIDFLVQLCLGDLTAADRQRVAFTGTSRPLGAEIEPGLVRLALRNLLRNALEHGSADTPVALEVAEQTSPAALLLRVANSGAPISAAALEVMQGPTGTEITTPAPGRQRLGLLIVRKVMALHGGALRVQAGVDGGAVATLVFPRRAA